MLSMQEAMKVVLQVREVEWIRECRAEGPEGLKALLTQLSVRDQDEISKWLAERVRCANYFTFGKYPPGRDSNEEARLREVAGKLRVTSATERECRFDGDPHTETCITFDVVGVPELHGCEFRREITFYEHSGSTYGLSLHIPSEPSQGKGRVPMLSMEFGGGASYGYHKFQADTVLQREQYPLLGVFLDALGVEMSALGDSQSS